MPTQPTPAFVLAVGPNSVRIPVQPQAAVYHGAQQITNYGKQPIVVHESVERILTGKVPATCTQHGVTWLHASLASYRLMPGQTARVPFTVNIAPHMTGTAALIATGSSTGKTGHNAHVGGGVATRIQIGDGAQQCHQASVVIHSASSGAPTGLIIMVGCLAALLIAGVAWSVWYGRRRRQSS